ncbi:MAG TPA: CHAT domain-containing protein, partial [Pirellulales bacterium]|nr:CHAT domain-containing protein [Pirellulales bacterium]
RLAALARVTPKPEEAAKVQAAVAALSESVEGLQQKLSRLDPDFHRAWAERTISSDDLRQLLPKDVALIDLLEYDHYIPATEKGKNLTSEKRIVAFVLRGDLPVACVELGSSATIAQIVDAWRAGYGHLASADGEAPGPELRRMVWEPLAAHLSDAETVLISPDGALAQLPWSALPGERPGTYLIEERALAVIAIPQLLPELLAEPARSGPPGSLLLAGDIEYGGDPGVPREALAVRSASGRGNQQFDRLEAAQAELASIRDWYEQADAQGTVVALRRRNATEGAFRDEVPNHRWLHLITHGFFAPAQLGGAAVHPGLLSGLAFAGANTAPIEGSDDGILTALEVASLDLSKVDTIVLSACETGLGQAAGGEGLLGLQRAFQVAGARTVVASLWKVPDRATSTLMQRFYENLWDKKMGKLAALREAQVFMIHDTGNRGLVVDKQPLDDGTLPPYYWAAFVLSGDWR